MESIFVDLVIAVTLAEAVGLVLYRRLTGHGLRSLEIVPNLAAGLCLMAALRCVLHSTSWGWAAMFLALAGAAHLFDLRARWRQGGSGR